MRFPRRTTSALLSLALLTLGLGRASAQDFISLCPQTPGMTLCLADLAKVPRSTSPLNRFARLAGMFMGRVTIASVGGLSLRLNLELR